MHLRQATHIITYGRPLVVVVVVEVVVYCLKVFKYTRSYAALRAADLDWIVRPGYSWGKYIWRQSMKNQPGKIKNHVKPTWNHK